MKEGDHQPGPSVKSLRRMVRSWSVAETECYQVSLYPHLTDAATARKQQESPFRVNLELKVYKLVTHTEVDQVLERFWWEVTSKKMSQLTTSVLGFATYCRACPRNAGI